MARMGLMSFTEGLTPAQAEALRTLLEERDFEFKEIPHPLQAASTEKLRVKVLTRGGKPRSSSACSAPGRAARVLARARISSLAWGRVLQGMEITERPRAIRLEQRTKVESAPAVAAASILSSPANPLSTG